MDTTNRFARRALAALDLTSLDESDTPERIRLSIKAVLEDAAAEA